MYIPTAIVFATADCLASHLQKKGSHCGRVSQYSLKMMYPRQLFLGRVSIATGIRDSTTHKNKRFKGFRPQLICYLLKRDYIPGNGRKNGNYCIYYVGFVKD